MKSGLDCVQCIEASPDSMNHCVPDWDATGGKEMDILWEPTDLFSSSKEKRDSGHTRKSDLGFVPEFDFEELCWEDGQLFVVMQGLNSRGTARHRNTYQTGDTTLMSASPICGTFDTPRATELVDPSSVNMQTQEDELFSWLQHPPEDLVERLEAPGDLPMASASSAPISKLIKPDKPSCTGNRSGHGIVNQHSELSAAPTLVPSAATQKDVLCEPNLALTAEIDMSSRSLVHSGSVSKHCGALVPNPSTNAMNFSNFSRPAVAVKANLQSLGIGNGLSCSRRLKQLETVVADIRKSESVDSLTKDPKVIATRKKDSALFSRSVEDSFIQSTPHNSLQKGVTNIASAPCSVRRSKQHSSVRKEAHQESCALTKPLPKGIESNAGRSLFISGTQSGVDTITEVFKIPEPSALSSSEGSEDSVGIDGKASLTTLKRKTYEEGSESQSEALENETVCNKRQVTAGRNDSKKCRASENHNQSERRRRDRISEKMKTLQALLPASYKTDKASMLEEAIEYIKAIKSQIQMMSQRSSTSFSPRILCHGVQHLPMAAYPFISTDNVMDVGMGINVGMGMHGMNMLTATTALRPFLLPMMSFPNTSVPAVQTNTSAEFDTVHPGIAAHVFVPPHHPLMAPVRPGNLMSGKSDFSQVATAAPTPKCPLSQQGNSVQDIPPRLRNGYR